MSLEPEHSQEHTELLVRADNEKNIIGSTYELYKHNELHLCVCIGER